MDFNTLRLLRANLALKAWSFRKVPLLYWVRPSLRELTDDKVVLAIPLLRRNRNHLNSMYFGVLACGADIAGGFLALQKIQESGQDISLVFKDFKAQFLKRPEAETLFVCEDGKAIGSLVSEAAKTGQRVHMTVHVTALCPRKFGDDPVAQFELTLSLKKVALKKA